MEREETQVFCKWGLWWIQSCKILQGWCLLVFWTNRKSYWFPGPIPMSVEIALSPHGGLMGVTPIAGWFIREQSHLKMMTVGFTISGNHHISSMYTPLWSTCGLLAAQGSWAVERGHLCYGPRAVCWTNRPSKLGWSWVPVWFGCFFSRFFCSFAWVILEWMISSYIAEFLLFAVCHFFNFFVIVYVALLFCHGYSVCSVFQCRAASLYVGIIRCCFAVMFGGFGFLSCSLCCSCPCGRLLLVFESC